MLLLNSNVCVHTTVKKVHVFWRKTGLLFYKRLNHPVHRSISSSADVRKTFLDYFKQKDHLYVHSSSIIPKKNEGTYFVNAGMNQFKPIFLGTVDPGSQMAGYKRVVNSQKCIRVGGKHNDLDDVGRDTYHHTFFEMLGSWSFGDYFKEESCKMAWELLTEIYGLSPDRLYVSYFAGNKNAGLQPDHECKEIWRSIGVAEERILPFPASDNFWDMGETGPCGPCTEIHYDHLGRPWKEAAPLVNAGSADLVEIWNLVFMQFNREADGSLRPLPRQHVDTGLGLERLTAVLQGKISNYDTDLFTPLFNRICEHSKVRAYSGKLSDPVDTAYRIVADHIRMLTVAIADGIVPGRGTRNAMIRHVAYRALRQANDVLGAHPKLLPSLVPLVVDSLGPAFPELMSNVSGICDVLEETESRYMSGRQSALTMLHKALNTYGGTRCLSGEQMHEIIDGRFGEPVSVDILSDAATSQGLQVDRQGYEHLVQTMAEERATAVIEDSEEKLSLSQYDLEWLTQHDVPETDDSHKYLYTVNEHRRYEFPPMSSRVVAVFDGSFFHQSSSNTESLLAILLDSTCFYAERGGQLADEGTIESQGMKFHVSDVQAYQNYVLHIGALEEGSVSVGDTVMLHIDQGKRVGCMHHHTATHLLNHALTAVLGDITQQGSTVSHDRLTFDFSSLKVSVSAEELEAVSDIVNNMVEANIAVHRDEVPLDQALQVNGLCHLKDAIYPQQVRVVSVGQQVSCLLAEPQSNLATETSVELCGGTHVDRTGDIGAVVITNFTGSQQGVKSVSAICGQLAAESLSAAVELEQQLCELQQWTQTNTNVDSWVKTATAIDKALSEGGNLPKLTRDRVAQELAQLQLKFISPLKNKSVKELYRQNLLALEQKSKGCVISEFSFDKMRDMVAVLASSQLDRPVMLFSNKVMRTERNKSEILGVCYVPKDYPNFSAKKWALHISNQMEGSTKPPQGKHAKHKNICTFQIALSANKPLDYAFGLAQTYYNLYRR